MTRSNVEWLQALSGGGAEHEAAVEDLRQILVQGLGYALAGRSNVRAEDVEDFAQDAVVKILGVLSSFRGESQFTTWAHKVAVNLSLSELRRRRWQDVSLEALQETPEGELLPDRLVDPQAGPERQTLQRSLLTTVRRVLHHELSERQCQALRAVMAGMPLAEVAQRLDTNPNALYKLIHDARKRLKEKLLAEGLSFDEVLGAFES